MEDAGPVWPDWTIYCTLGNFSKPVTTIILGKMKHFRQFLKVSKSFIFLVKSFLALFIDIWWFFLWPRWQAGCEKVRSGERWNSNYVGNMVRLGFKNSRFSMLKSSILYERNIKCENFQSFKVLHLKIIYFWNCVIWAAFV